MPSFFIKFIRVSNCHFLSLLSLFHSWTIFRDYWKCFERTFWRKNKYFQKKPTFEWISNKPNGVPAEWCWQLRFESTMGYFADILTRFSEFCQNDNIVLSNLSRQQHSAVLNLASLVKKPWKEMWAFFEKICFSARMSSWNTSNYPYILSSCGSLFYTTLCPLHIIQKSTKNMKCLCKVVK